ncbi:BTB/POZ domain-containing protein [Platanthera guangdongensis]|uniref:BTB/POZ domain-containing protein n=1 Tax=Platanthera guangdongensis TaxID=2320717 RepID=A0ABR2MND7_9ASPA
MGTEIFDIDNDDHAKWRVSNFLESWDFSDVMFLVGVERKVVPAHKVILNAYGDFSFSSSRENIIHLPSTAYEVLLEFLEYIYSGQTQVVESQLDSLRDSGLWFNVLSLIKECNEISNHFKTNKNLIGSGKKVERLSSSFEVQQWGIFPHEMTAVIGKLKQFLATDTPDVEVVSIHDSEDEIEVAEPTLPRIHFKIPFMLPIDAEDEDNTVNRKHTSISTILIEEIAPWTAPVQPQPSIPSETFPKVIIGGVSIRSEQVHVVTEMTETVMIEKMVSDAVVLVTDEDAGEDVVDADDNDDASLDGYVEK